MLRSEILVGLAAVGTLALNAAPAAAQAEAGSQEVHVYGGQLFGDDLTDTPISGRTPELDDDVTYGVRYGYNFTDAWGIELSLGRTASSVIGLAGGDVDMDVSTLERRRSVALESRIPVCALPVRRCRLRHRRPRRPDSRHREWRRGLNRRR